MFNQFKHKNDNTLKTVLAVIGGVFAVAAIVGAVIAVVKIVNKKMTGNCCCEDDCLCDECWCDDEFCGEPCTCNDPLTVVAEGREVTDETESGESI